MFFDTEVIFNTGGCVFLFKDDLGVENVTLG